MTSKTFDLIADELWSLQAKQNNGRGISCVQTVVHLIRHGLIDEAERVADWDHDKIRNYPEVWHYINDNFHNFGYVLDE
jgi:hypothetical protein